MRPVYTLAGLVLILIAPFASIGLSRLAPVDDEALIEAVCAGNTGAVERWILQGGDPANYRIGADTLLTWMGGAKCGLSLPMIELLIKRGVDPHAADHNNLTPIIIAALNCNISAIRIYVKNGVSINTVNRIDSGNTNVLTACLEISKKDEAIHYVNTLLKLGFDPNIMKEADIHPDWRRAWQGVDIEVIFKTGRTLLN